MVWNYGQHMVCKSGAEDRKIKSGEKLTKCLCGGDRCPVGSWLFN